MIFSMKRIIILCIILSLFLVACGGDKEGTSSTEQSIESSSAMEASSVEASSAAESESTVAESEDSGVIELPKIDF